MPPGLQPSEIAGAVVLDPPGAPAVDVDVACEEALEAPWGVSLERLARRGDRVVILVPDATRDTPRASQVGAVLSRLRGAGVAAEDIVAVVATGAHASGPPPPGGFGCDALGRPARIHDGRSEALRPMGRMPSIRARFLPGFLESESARVAARVPGSALRLRAAATAGRARVLRVAPEVADADLVVSLGAVVPHPIAGFAGGAKMIFPGVADARSIRENHALRMHPSVRRGAIEPNLAREHLEAAVRLVGARRFCLDVLPRPGGGVLGAVAGDPDLAVREGARRLRPALEVAKDRPFDVVVCVVEGPAGRTVYQATKGAAAAAPLVAPDGAVVVVAGCEEGVGDLPGARRIVALGLRTALPPRARLLLVSGAEAPSVRRVGFEPRRSLDETVAEMRAARVAVLPRALHVL